MSNGFSNTSSSFFYIAMEDAALLRPSSLFLGLVNYGLKASYVCDAWEDERTLIRPGGYGYLLYIESVVSAIADDG